MTETIQESPMTTNPTKPAKQKKLWIGIVGGIVALLALVIGFQAYKKHSFKSALRPYALKDNVLIEDMLSIESSGKGTFAGYFDKAKKNIEAREQLIQDIRLIDPGAFKKEVDMYVDILKLENEYIQSKVAQFNAYLEKGRLEGVKEKWEEICSRFWDAGCSTDIPKIRREVEAAATEWGEKIKENAEANEKWLSKEKDYHKALSAFLPARNLIPKLEEMVKSKSSIQTVKASKWWLYAYKQNDCVPAEKVQFESGAQADMSPDQMMLSYPECKISSNKDGMLYLDCSQSKLKTSFLYGDSKESCLSIKEAANKGRQ